MIKHLSIILSLILTSCSFSQEHALRSPDHIYPLKKELKEISGLSLMDTNHLVAIQDEKGYIFSLSIDHFIKKNKLQFAKKGDYEGIATGLGRYFILKSNGNIISVDRNGESKKVFKPHFKNKIEFEGLCFDSKQNRLLILCKDHSSKKKNKYINIYEFDLNSEQFNKNPVLKLDKKKAGIHNPQGLLPSGIAINPLDGYIYIVASVGKKLIVLNNEGQFVHYYNLDETIYKQPEGITFSKSGELYIASEGKSGNAQVMHFISIP